MFSRRFIRYCGGFLILGLLALPAGCGSKTARATVRGKVTLGEKPLTTGSVIFHGADNASASATIGKEGNYELQDAPVGLVRITVMVPKMPPGGIRSMMPAGGKDIKDKASVDPENPERSIPIMGEIPKNIVPIPDRYGNVETSVLTFTVEKGEQTHNITLTP